MGKNTMITCPSCGKQLPVSRKGKLPRHYEENRPSMVCDQSNKTIDISAELKKLDIVTLDAKYLKGKVKLVFGRYGNGRTAIMLQDPHTEEPMATATVNLPEAQIAAGHVFLKGWSENEGIPEALEKAGVVKLTGDFVPTGFTAADVAKLLVEVPA